MSADGVLVVNKPVGPTSHDIVATARRALRLRRIGHTGTLDPQASGVLPLVVGQATRLAQYLSGADKEYDAVIRFGIETDTYDRAGQVVRETREVPAKDRLVAALERFRGGFDQLPPPFSAKKIEGERAYVLARRDSPVALRPVAVTVHALSLVAFDPPLATLRLTCSAGFYVRSLAHDLGQLLTTGATLDALVRCRAGAFALDTAIDLHEVVTNDAARTLERMIPMEGLLLDMPAVRLSPEGRRRAVQGQDLGPADLVGGVAPAAAMLRLLSPEGRVIGIAQPAKTPGLLHPSMVFG
jgi:tRNA pseudouridine55 synthase